MEHVRTTTLYRQSAQAIASKGGNFTGLFIRVLFLCALSSSASAQQSVIATPYAESTFHTRNIREFAREVKELSVGRVDIAVRPNATLLKAPEIFPAVQRGDVQFGEVILSSLVKESQLFGLDAIPFLANGYGDARKLWRTSRPAIEAEFAKRGVVLLYAVPWPPQHLYATKPVERTSDMRGLRFRTYNQATQRIAELSEAQPIQIEVAEVGKAINENRMDVMLTSSISGVDTKAWSRMRYFYTVSAWSPKNVVLMNKKAFDALDSVSQKALRSAADRAEERGWQWSEEADREAQRELARNNIAVLPPSLLLSTQFRYLGERMAGEWVKQAGSEGLRIIIEYESARRQ